MGFTSWIDQQIAEAERRGVFDDLPGAGKPLKLRPGAADGDYGQAWLRDYAQREGVAAEEMLPTPLRLRREIERLAETAGEFRSEQEVREAAADLNRRIVEWRRIPVGPPVHVRLVNADDLVARWRAARSDQQIRHGRERRVAPAGLTGGPGEGTQAGTGASQGIRCAITARLPSADAQHSTAGWLSARRFAGR
jgi:DnaJ homologue, subfamily C, member 28, conserved domain